MDWRKYEFNNIDFLNFVTIYYGKNNHKTKTLTKIKECDMKNKFTKTAVSISICLMLLLVAIVYADSWSIEERYKTKAEALQAADQYLKDGWTKVEIWQWSKSDYEFRAWKSN